jgi:hypothetical protein
MADAHAWQRKPANLSVIRQTAPDRVFLASLDAPPPHDGKKKGKGRNGAKSAAEPTGSRPAFAGTAMDERAAAPPAPATLATLASVFALPADEADEELEDDSFDPVAALLLQGADT